MRLLPSERLAFAATLEQLAAQTVIDADQRLKAHCMRCGEVIHIFNNELSHAHAEDL